MPNQDQLEIIRTDGEIEFYSLDPAKGITNIGRHPENDIVIDRPGVPPFLAMLDHRRKPYQLLLLSEAGQGLTVSDEPLAVNVAHDLYGWDNIQVDGYTLILIEDETNGAGAGAAVIEAETPSPPAQPGPATTAPSPPPARPARSSRPTTRPEPAGQAPAPSQTQPAIQRSAGFFQSQPSDQTDDVILTTISDREWTIDVEQTATFQMTVTNGGQIVAAFDIWVDGIPQEWVVVEPSQVNLYEGDRATVTITVTPPREPTSRAGTHFLAVMVTSPNYPRRRSRRGARLVLNPYYEFNVGELSPRRQTVSWFSPTGTSVLPVINTGNSNVPLRLEGADDEQACSFEFDVPGEQVALAKQAELRLAPEEEISIPIRITPHSRQLIGFRRRSYPFTISAMLLEGQQTPRSMLGEVKTAPLIGPLLLLLMAFLTTVLILILVRPRVYTFMFTDGGQQAVISNSTPVAMRWAASFFTTDLRIEPEIEDLERPLPPRGTAVAYPRSNTTYTLTGNNALSRLAPALFAPPTKVVEVDVNPIAPAVTFEAQPSQIIGEGEVTLRWSVDQADKLELFRRVGDNGALEFIGDYSDQLATTLQVTPQPDESRTTYVLIASNAYVPTTTPVPRLVILLTPTPTASPTPGIVFFTANPQTINEGEESTLAWEVIGVQQVTIQGVDSGSALPANYSLAVQPTASTDYILTVPGAPPRPVRVNVTPAPTATPVPDAPTIVFFTANPTELIQGKAESDEDEKDVTLQWSITGEVTNVEINAGPNLGVFSNLNSEGSLPLTIDENTVFVLTAFNQDKTNSATIQVEVLEATATPTAPPPPTATATPIPPPVIVFFIAEENSEVVFVPGNDPPKYEVVAGSDVTLDWETKEADSVSLVGIQDVSTSGPKTLTNFTQSDVVELRAENAGGITSDQLELEVVAPPPPPPPTNLDGVEGTDAITLTWSYDSDEKDNIEGFRVYSVDSPGSPLVDEGTLDENATTWTDAPLASTCDRGYYVVAVYIDPISGDKMERPTNSSWYSSPC